MKGWETLEIVLFIQDEYLGELQIEFPLILLPPITWAEEKAEAKKEERP